MQDRRAYVKWKEVFLVGHHDLANAVPVSALAVNLPAMHSRKYSRGARPESNGLTGLFRRV